jgi:hypothetical protein
MWVGCLWRADGGPSGCAVWSCPLLASPTGLGFQWIKLVRVWSVTSWALADYIYRVSKEGRAKLREGVPYVKLYRYNPKHLYPKLNGYQDNGQRKVCLGVAHTTTGQPTLIHVRPCVGCHVTEFLLRVARSQELLECSWRAEGLASDSKQSIRFVLWWLCSEQ